MIYYFRGDQFMDDFENKELNRELCALTVDDTFESWSPGTQEQVLAEWNDWQDEPKKSGYMCDQCDKVFSRSSALRRHVQSLHSERRRHTCDLCEKSFASEITCKGIQKPTKRRSLSVINVIRNLIERYSYTIYVE